MVIAGRKKAAVTFDENVTINQPEVLEEAADLDDKKYSLDSDEEDGAGRSDKRLHVDDIDGQETGIARRDGGQAITPFNLDEENEEGHFDESGTFIFKKKDSEEIRDSWLDSIDMQKPAENIPLKDFDKEPTPDPLSKLSTTEILEEIVAFLQPTESVKKALKRLGGTQLSASQRLKMKKKGQKPPDCTADKESLEKLTSLSDWLLHQGRDTIYQDTYEKLTYEMKEASDDIFGDAEESNSSKRVKLDVSENKVSIEVNWYYRVDGQTLGPLPSSEMLKMQTDNAFKPGTEVCKESNKDKYYSANRIDFDDYID